MIDDRLAAVPDRQQKQSEPKPCIDTDPMFRLLLLRRVPPSARRAASLLRPRPVSRNGACARAYSNYPETTHTLTETDPSRPDIFYHLVHQNLRFIVSFLDTPVEEVALGWLPAQSESGGEAGLNDFVENRAYLASGFCSTGNMLTGAQRTSVPSYMTRSVWAWSRA